MDFSEKKNFGKEVIIVREFPKFILPENTSIQEDELWALLAGTAMQTRNVYAAEIAFGALDEVCYRTFRLVQWVKEMISIIEN